MAGIGAKFQVSVVPDPYARLGWACIPHGFGPTIGSMANENVSLFSHQGCNYHILEVRSP